MEPATTAPCFATTLDRHGVWPLRRGPVRTLQVNVGRVCNQACHHCHVEAGPTRTESMDRRTAERVVELLEQNPGVELLDLTGGAPELNPHFRTMVVSARDLGRRVIDRCNLTVLLEPGQEDTAQFLADHRVEIVASLPCYLQENVERQRGKGVYDRSIEALQRLNKLGYGRNGSPLVLDLVYNPAGPSLPPGQADLEAAYRRELQMRFGLEFSRLLTLTNMPINRFADTLQRTGQHAAYLSLLVNHFNPTTIPELMCTSLLSVGYDGWLYDCDFNQMLELPLADQERTIWDLRSLEELEGLDIATGSHCFGCTAGSGSSCRGALA
jgi:radical SAM/Cys-rich protein